MPLPPTTWAPAASDGGGETCPTPPHLRLGGETLPERGGSCKGGPWSGWEVRAALRPKTPTRALRSATPDWTLGTAGCCTRGRGSTLSRPRSGGFTPLFREAARGGSPLKRGGRVETRPSTLGAGETGLAPPPERVPCPCGSLWPRGGAAASGEG